MTWWNIGSILLTAQENEVLFKHLGRKCTRRLWQLIDIEDIKELRRATDLSLRATKETARAIGHSMAALAATERHLWLNLSGIKERDRAFLLDALLAPPGFFSDAVSSVVEKFQEAKKQATAFQKFTPHLQKSHGAAAKGQPQQCTSGSLYRQRQAECCVSSPSTTISGLESENTFEDRYSDKTGFGKEVLMVRSGL
ncbi:unnamed protein product [Leuciscus chuanchicus]